MEDEKFDVVFHHEGKFVNEGRLIYDNGKLSSCLVTWITGVILRC